jgi:hypothetical protein
MHDIALLETANFCGTQTAAEAVGSRPSAQLRYDSFQSLSPGDA